MLTREEAKKRRCIYSYDANRGTCGQFKRRCQAEKCQKWVDTKNMLGNFCKTPSCSEGIDCSKCQEAFGRCG